MSDQVSEVKIELSAEDRASAVVKSLRNELEKTISTLKKLAEIKLPDTLKSKLDAPDARAAVAGFEKAAAAARRFGDAQAGASRKRRADARAEADERQDLDRRDVAALRAKMAFRERMTRQRTEQEASAERQRRTIEAATMRDLRDRLAFSFRMGRQRANEAREAERTEAAATRSRIAGERQFRREQERTHREAVSWTSKAFSRGRETVREITRPPAAVAAAGTAGAVAGARRVLRAEGDVDAAEVSTRAYGGLSANAARSLREFWAAPLAETLGAQTDKLLTAWTDAVKLGIPAAGAKSFAELATKTSSAWEVPFEQVTDIFGTVNTLLTAKGAPFDPDRLKSVANTLQHLAAKQSTTPERMISFLQRGAGAADVLGMSQEAGLAFGSASTSLGNQAGQSGRLFDYVASRLIEMPRLTRGHGDQAKQARELVNALGYGSAQAMDTARRRDPDAFLPDFMNRFSRIKDKKKQDQAIRFFTGREWLGEFGRMVKGIDTYREAIKLAKEAKGLDAIGAVWDLHRTKLAFVFKQFRAGWLNILGQFGMVLSPMARQAGDYWLEWTAKLRGGGLQARFKAALDGLVEGLGFKNFPELLRGIFGQPGEGTAGTIEAWKSFARGFGQGLRDVADTIKALFRAFAGSDGTPESIGRWTARILAFSAALVLASPVIGVLGALGTAILAFTATARAAVAAWRALGLAGTAGTAAGGAASGAAAGGFLGWLRGAFRLAPAFAAPLTMDPSKADNDRLMRRLGEWARGQQKAETDPPARVERQSAAEDWRGHIVPASFSQDGRMAAAFERLERAVSSDRARFQLASIAGATSTALGRATAISGGSGNGGGASGGGAGFGPSGLPKAPGMNVPGWYGRGSGGGTVARGALAANQKEAFAAAREAGLSETAARALVANMSGESLANPRDHHWDRKHMSQGIVQWDPQRAEAIRSRFGKLPKDMSVAEQTRAAIWEIRSNPRFGRTNRALEGDDPGAMLDALVRNYEAPADPGRAIAERQRHYNGFKPGEADATAKGGQFDGLRVKGAQATAGGETAEGVTDLARSVQNDIPGVRHFSAFNDRFHQNTRSKHAHGLAFDTSITDPSKSSEMAEAIRAKLRAAGLSAEAYRIIDEYKNPSARSTGGHIHTQFNSREAADAYHRSVSELAAKAKPRATPEDLAKGVSSEPKPVRVMNGGSMGGDALGGTTVHAPVTIHAGAQSPGEIAGHLQRHVQEARGFRSHDLEPELT